MAAGVGGWQQLREALARRVGKGVVDRNSGHQKSASESVPEAVRRQLRRRRSGNECRLAWLLDDVVRSKSRQEVPRFEQVRVERRR